MAEDLLKIVEREITNNVSPDQIRGNLLREGYLENEIDAALRKMRDKHQITNDQKKDVVRLLGYKEFFERIGYGFVPHQFLNILFYLIGAGYFWLGILNGARSVLSVLFSSLLQEFSKVKHVTRGIISTAGYVFGFSFIGLGLSTLIHSVPLFAFFLLLGSVGIVMHGDLYSMMVNNYLKGNKGTVLARLAKYGVLLTAACMILSGWLLEKYPIMGSETVNLMGNTYPLYGYLISFEITAIAFILAGHFLAKIKEEKSQIKDRTQNFLRNYLSKVSVHLKQFTGNPRIFLLIMASVLVGFSQVLGNSYYGVYIYKTFKDVWLGGFLNVAVIYVFAILASFLGPWFSKFMHRRTGLAPTLVFGTLLLALMPLTLAYNPKILTIGIANALSVIGASMLGVSQGLLARKLLHEVERKIYFSVVSVSSIIPFVILVPLGSYYANAYGLLSLFELLVILLVVVATPLYLILVIMSSKNRL